MKVYVQAWADGNPYATWIDEVDAADCAAAQDEIDPAFDAENGAGYIVTGIVECQHRSAGAWSQQCEFAGRCRHQKPAAYGLECGDTAAAGPVIPTDNARPCQCGSGVAWTECTGTPEAPACCG